MEKLRWGILGAGRITRRLAQALAVSSTGVLRAIGSRSQEKAAVFAEEFRLPCAYGSYEELLADAEIDAVYIATPHAQHAEWAIKAACAGKHILCEKPAAVSAAEAETMLAAVKEHGVFFLEAFMYRCHPQTALVLDLIRQGRIGEIRLMQYNFGFAAPLDRHHRLFANHLAGGAILDLGCYCLSWARLLAGAARGQPFAEPRSIKGLAELDPEEGTDILSTAIAEFEGGFMAQMSTSVRVNLGQFFRVIGTEGSLELQRPHSPGPDAKVVIQRDGKVEEIASGTTTDLYGYQIDLVARHHKEGQAPSPAMTWDDTLGNMRALDAWRREVGLIYRSEIHA